jgi:hypothetical protein
VKPVPRPDQDPSEAGKVGGVASGQARRRKRNRSWLDVLLAELERNPEKAVRNVLESRNGQAIAMVMRLAAVHGHAKRISLAELERRTDQADQALCRLLDETDREKRRRDELRAEARELEERARSLREILARDGETATRK